MDDPWNSDRNNFPSSDLTTGTSPDQLFDDNFSPPDQIQDCAPKNASFDPLPDSSTYLANLEKKLLKLQKKASTSSGAEKRDLIFSLAGAREGHIDRFLNSSLSNGIESVNFDEPVEESVSGTVIRHVAPHLQAVTTGELIHLLKADQLQETTSEETVESSETNSQPAEQQ